MCSNVEYQHHTHSNDLSTQMNVNRPSYHLTLLLFLLTDKVSLSKLPQSVTVSATELTSIYRQACV